MYVCKYCVLLTFPKFLRNKSGHLFFMNSKDLSLILKYQKTLELFKAIHINNHIVFIKHIVFIILTALRQNYIQCVKLCQKATC